MLVAGKTVGNNAAAENEDDDDGDDATRMALCRQSNGPPTAELDGCKTKWNLKPGPAAVAVSVVRDRDGQDETVPGTVQNQSARVHVGIVGSTRIIIDKPTVDGDAASCSNGTDSGTGQLKEDRRPIYVGRPIASDSGRNTADDSPEGSRKVLR